MGCEAGLVADRLRPVAIRARGQPRADHRVRQEAHTQAGGRRRPFHLPGHHGRSDQTRRARSDRRRATLDRGSVSSQEDRRGPRAGHPRVHWLQHLHLELARRSPGEVHAEPDHRRRMAPRVASRTGRPVGQHILRSGGRRRSRGPRVCADARPARLRGHPRRGSRRARRPVAFRDAPARIGSLGTRPRLAPWSIAAAAERKHLPRQPPVSRRHPGTGQHARGHCHRFTLGTPVVLGAGDSGGQTRGARGLHARRHRRRRTHRRAGHRLRL